MTTRKHGLRRDRVCRAAREAIEVAAAHVAEDADELVAALAAAHAIAVWMRAGEARAEQLRPRAPSIQWPKKEAKKKGRR